MSHTENMNVDLSGKTAIVTGAAGGIGSAIARALARSAATVVTVDADPRVEQVAAAIGGIAVIGDITAADFAATTVAKAVAATGRVDILINAAGIQCRTEAVDITAAQWARLLEVNLTAAYRLTAAARAPLARVGGAVVNIASLSADRAVPGIVAYGATKAALTQLGKGLAVELGADGIRVNTVSPGYIETPMTADVLGEQSFRDAKLARIPLGRLADGDDVADPVLFLVSDAARYITGVVLAVDGGYSIT